MEIYKKIQESKELIKKSNLKKEGKNKHFNYYTPEQVDKLVYDACLFTGLYNKVDLLRTELGLIVQITVISVSEKCDNAVFIMSTDKPAIPNANATQNMGGALTYSERYLLMSIYGIKDNNEDFDSQSLTKAPQKEQKESISRELMADEVDNKWNGKIYKGGFVYIDNQKIEVNPAQLEKLKEHKKYKDE